MRPTPSVAQVGAHRRRASPLVRFNRVLARPIAGLFGVLGFAPGQLSLQSLTITLAGLAAAANGASAQLAIGAGLVYLGVLADRADTIMAEKKGRPSAWTQFLGEGVDRLVEVALLAGLVLLWERHAQGPLPAWTPMSEAWFLTLAAGLSGLFLVVRFLHASAETLLLRTHLLSARRLPGPQAIPRHRPVNPFIEAVAGRDEAILVWCVGVALGQLQAVLIALLALQVILFLEQLVLFRLHLRDPEVEASRILALESR
jgi:hypothetical protein